MSSRRLAALRTISLLAATTALGCATEATEDTGEAESNWTAVPGEQQARLRATTGEEVVVAFDPVQKVDPRRPECSITVASPLRVRVYDRTSTAPEMSAKLDSFVRGRTVAFTRDDGSSPGAVTLRRVSPVAFGADLPDFVIDKSCSGEPLEYYQSYSFSIGGRSLLDPVGDKPTFWTRLALASESGVSALAKHQVDLQSTNGTKIQLAFQKLRGDDPSSPQTCERTEAVPIRVTVQTASPASSVELDLASSWKSRTTAPVADATSSPKKTLLQQSPTSFSIDLDPLTIDARCSGDPRTYWQKLVVRVDGQPVIDPIGQKPFFLTDLASAPAR